VFIIALVLFLLPCSLLFVAWRRYLRNATDPAIPKWRAYCGKAALIVGTFSTLFELLFYCSWFYNGGSRHGLLPPLGIWKFVGRISFWTLVSSVFLTVLGKGKWRLFIPAWAASFLLGAYLVSMLEMD
jgi:hypothetical protein